MNGCEEEGKNKVFLYSLPDTETFKANLPVGGEGGYALHATAHLGD